MSVKIVKINLIPVNVGSEKDWMYNHILKTIKPCRKIIDNYGANYKHEVPWNEKFIADPKFYLYRVRIGAVGRINTCRDAILLGLQPAKAQVEVAHFTSLCLYRVFRLAMTYFKYIRYMKDLEKDINNLLTTVSSNIRFLNYYDVTYEEEIEVPDED